MFSFTFTWSCLRKRKLQISELVCICQLFILPIKDYIPYIHMYLHWNLAQCQYLLIEQQTAQFTHKREATVKSGGTKSPPKTLSPI